MGEAVWDQHTRYLEARGQIHNPRAMFKSDLLRLLRECKAAGEEMLHFGDFNKDVYSGTLAVHLAGEELKMAELSCRMTGTRLLPTHTCGQTPINTVFATSGIVCMVVTLLPSLMGVGDHRVFILDIDSISLLGDVFPSIIPISHQLLNCTSDRIKHSYILALNQLSNRHLLFKKLLPIDKDSNRMSSARIHLRMNKVDLELEHFMKSAEHDCH
jgi:hypothetical protein